MISGGEIKRTGGVSGVGSTGDVGSTEELIPQQSGPKFQRGSASRSPIAHTPTRVGGGTFRPDILTPQSCAEGVCNKSIPIEELARMFIEDSKYLMG